MVTQVKHYINGNQVSGRNGRTSPVFNPATGEQTGLVPIANAADVADAVAAATKAAPGWAATTPLRRATILNRFLRILEDRIDELADVIVAEHGKVHSDAVGEIQRGMEVVEFATAAPQLLKVNSPRTSALASTATPRDSLSAWSPALLRSISLRWCRCGSFLSRLLAETPLS